MVSVYFRPATISSASVEAVRVFSELVSASGSSLSPHLPLKIHPGAIGNTAFIPALVYTPLISFLQSQQVAPVYIETCMEASDSSSKVAEFSQHGFDQIPVVIADGPDGKDVVKVPISNGKYFSHCYIAKGLAQADQVLVASHFKGHCMAGFGGAIKMLGIGFASSHGKSIVHSHKNELAEDEAVDWSNAHLPGVGDKWVQNWNPEVVSTNSVFRERISEYALAASQGKNHLYLTFALNIVNNCDCDGSALTPVYNDLGVFASTDPVAIDKAVFDLLTQREGEKPFQGEDIFSYSETLGLGSAKYHLIKL